MTESSTIIKLLMAGAHLPDPALKREVIDAQWSDFGQRVHDRIVLGEGLIEALNRAGMKAKSTREMAGMVRAFILCGTKP